MFDDIVAGMDDAAPLRAALAKREDYRGELSTDDNPVISERYFGILTYVGEFAVVTVGNPLFHSFEKGLVYVIKTGQAPPRFLSTVVVVGDGTVNQAVKKSFADETLAVQAGSLDARAQVLLDLIPVIKGHGDAISADDPFGLHDDWVAKLRNGDAPETLSVTLNI